MAVHAAHECAITCRHAHRAGGGGVDPGHRAQQLLARPRRREDNGPRRLQRRIAEQQCRSGDALGHLVARIERARDVAHDTDRQRGFGNQHDVRAAVLHAPEVPWKLQARDRIDIPGQPVPASRCVHRHHAARAARERHRQAPARPGRGCPRRASRRTYEPCPMVGRARRPVPAAQNVPGDVVRGYDARSSAQRTPS